MRRALRIFALLGLVPPLAAAAGPAHLAADLNPGVEAFDREDTSANSAFGGYTAVNGRVVFLAFFPKGSPAFYQFQCGLWVTDGTPGSAEPLADLCGEEENLQHFVRILGSNGSLAFFTDSGDRLWRTDGTAAGTFPVARVVVSGPAAFAPGGRLFFTGCPPGQDCHLWTSDGSSQGTGPVGDAPPASGNYGISMPVFAGSLALYTAGDTLWASDGTRQGTFQLARVPASGGIADLVVQGGRAYFAAFNGSRVNLWTADPVTRKVRKLRSFAFDFEEGGFVLFPVGGRLLVVSNDGRVTTLWETDGTRAGTRQLGPPLAYNSFIDRIFDVRGWAVFSAPRGRSTTPRIWSLEPGAKRPLPLPGPAGLSLAQVFAGRLYYLVRDADGYVLRVTDGTVAGTRVLKDLCPQGCEVAPVGFQEVLGRLVIATPDGTLWKTDGTAAGTLPFAHRPPQLYSLQPDFLVATADGRAIFTGFDPVNGPQPWSSDLTPEHSGPIENVGDNLAAGARIVVLSSVGSKALFPACDGVAEGIWVSDGTEAGTTPLPGTEQQPCGKPPGPFAFFYRVGGLTYFSWKGQLWRTDGTPGGTASLLGLNPAYPYVYSAAPLGGRLFFYPVPADPAHGPFVFWTSDGTPAGTQPAFSLSTGPSGPFLAAGGLVFFEAGRTSPPFGVDLWRTDGTEAGTRPLLQIVPEIVNETPPVVWTGSRYVFLAAGVQRGGEELELWVSDGTAAGTAPVIADPSAPRPFKPLGLVAFQGAAYFFAGGDSEHPPALWRTDGTAAGTFPLKTVNRPSNSQALDGMLTPELTPVGNQLFFRADDGVHGSEI